MLWWNRSRPAAPSSEEVTIKARLKKGETLHITFADDREPRQMDIEGRGEVRLRIKSMEHVTAELRESGKRDGEG